MTTCNLTLLVVKDVPFDLIIELSALRTMSASLDFDKDAVTFRSGTKDVTVALWAYKRRTGQELSGEFTSEECTSQEDGYEDSKSEGESDGSITEIEAAGDE